MCIHLHIHVHIYLDTHRYTHINICIYGANTHKYMLIWSEAMLLTCATLEQTPTHTHTYTHTHTHSYLHVYRYIHTYTTLIINIYMYAQICSDAADVCGAGGTLCEFQRFS